MSENRKPMTAKEKQQDKMRQEMARRKEAAEAKKRAVAAKKKRATIVVIAIACVVVITAIAVGVPLGIRAKAQYKTYNFQSFTIPTTSATALKAASSYNEQKCVFEGYLTTCGSNLDILVLCKTKIECPYVNGQVTSEGIVVERANGRPFTTEQVECFAKVYGTLMINSSPIDKGGNNTYAYMLVDKVEVES